MNDWLRGWWVRFWRGGISLLDKDIEAVLSERDPSLKEIYVGSFAVLEDSTNPEHIQQSAHSFREVIEKLPKIADEVYVDVQPSKDRFNNLSRDALNKWEIKPFRSIEDLDEQTILNAVDILNRLKEAQSEIIPRRLEIYNFLGHEFSAEYSPKDDYLSDIFNKRNELTRFFSDVCHHRFVPDISEFEQKINELNYFLSTILVKTPTADTNEIDEILNG